VKVAFVGDHETPFVRRVVDDLRSLVAARGHDAIGVAETTALPDDVQLVFNATSADEPRPNYLRQRPSQLVCTLVEARAPEESVSRAAYRVLVKTMSNLLVYAVPEGDSPASYMLTPELGFQELAHDEHHATRIADKALALAGARWVIDNDVATDLPEALWNGDDSVRSMQRVGRQLDALGLLPTVLPLEELLSERDRRMLMKVFGITQLSYGNLSARRDATSFWMTGRGVDKGSLREVGRDVLLVTGFDADAGRVRVSVPPGTDARARASVDAVEHALLYRELPRIGAILHVHAWLSGIDSTRQSWPCGSVELAQETLDLVARQRDPANAVIGLVNHGITATGPDLETIFTRIAPRLERRVPMA
jgi:ribulose-5-phosphate 4-epimerase/fuculose-1-phosphate aldolase